MRLDHLLSKETEVHRKDVRNPRSADKDSEDRCLILRVQKTFGDRKGKHPEVEIHMGV